jgi:NitT/TauT family transport system permease protein
LVGQGEVFGRGWPPFSDVLGSFVKDQEILRRAAVGTIWDAVRGFAAGLALGISLAVIGLVIIPLRRGIGRLATVVNSIPWIALGPLIVMVVSSSATPLVFASLAVFFSSFIAVSSGFNLVSGSHQDVFTVLGASRLSRFRRLEMPAVLPSIVYAAKLGAPAAMFGVVFGEWFGTTEPGLGLVMVVALQQFFTARLWAAAGLTALIAIVAFGLFALVEELVRRRDFAVRQDVRELAGSDRPEGATEPASWRGRLADIALTVWPFILVVGFWQFAVTAWDVSPIVAPTPMSVVRDIGGDPGTYLSYTFGTLQMAAVGLFIGSLIGLVAALASWLSPVLKGLLTTPMIIMYSVPLVATVPIMARVIGYTRTTVVAVAALVSMFPTFVLVSSGFRSTPPGADDVLSVMGARRRARLRHLALPSAVPDFLTALRLNGALAIVAAILGEFLTGRDGLGWLFALSYAALEMPRAWGSAVVIVILSVVVYVGASRLEERGQQRML